MKSVLIYDTETTGKLANRDASIADTQPSLVQLAARLEDYDTAATLAEINLIIQPAGWVIPDEAAAIHGITQAKAMSCGVTLANACYLFRDLFAAADRVVAHNDSFDRTVMKRAIFMAQAPEIDWNAIPNQCTMRAATNIVRIPHKHPKHPKDYKWPRLEECVRFFFNEPLEGAHDALVDVRACARVYRELLSRGVEF
jgi:DNA polymerase-3 subunit epsilon